MSFDGETLAIVDSGKTVGLDKPGGAHEPSIVEMDGCYYLTIRSEYNDDKMYQATSEDGLNWDNLAPWRWDDGSVIETKNTQQHWLKHDNDLYLVYTRTNELNNGVFRDRAPLFIAQVDLKTLRLIRDTEKIVFPEKGARMGNFCIANITDTETWIITGEWLQQQVPSHCKGMRFWYDCGDNRCPANRIQYIGDLLLARVCFT